MSEAEGESVRDLHEVIPAAVAPAPAGQFNSSSTGSPYGQMADRNESQAVRGARAADALALALPLASDPMNDGSDERNVP